MIQNQADSDFKNPLSNAINQVALSAKCDQDIKKQS